MALSINEMVGMVLRGSSPRAVIEKKWSKDIKTKWTPPKGFFTQSAAKIAKGLLAASDSKKQAMSRLNFYINRAGKNLGPKDKARLDKAKAMISKSK